MEMYSLGFKVLPKSTVRLEGDIIFIWVTFLSMRSCGMENSSSMQSGMAPPHGLAPLGVRSKRYVSIPPDANASAAEDPAGPPPITAAVSFRPEICVFEVEVAEMVSLGRGVNLGFGVLKVRVRE
ncbi:hypothetical protein HanIR_Chr03g0135641 [Helianthus annuus]|nr:hypothetical protein HanIR_Chr03g0135641 [Helianthus annuus]